MTSNQKLSVFGGFALLHNNIIGPGIVGLPAAFAVWGWFGALLLLAGMIGSYLGLFYLAELARFNRILSKYAGEEAPLTSFSRVSDLIGQPWFRWIIDIGNLIACFGAATSSLMVAGDSFSYVFNSIDGVPSVLRSRLFCVVVIFLCFCLPLALLRNLRHLRFSSTLSIVMVWYLLFMCVFKFFQGVEGFEGVDVPLPPVTDGWKLLTSVTVFTFVFCGHMNMMQIANELENPTRRRLNMVIWLALGATSVVYLIFSIFTYLTFGRGAAGNVLKSYGNNFDAVVMVARVGVAIVSMAFFPLLVAPQRTIVSDIVVDLSGERIKPGLALHLGSSLLICGLAFLIASFGIDLGTVYSMFGATGFVLLCYIAPAYLYLKLAKRVEEETSLKAAKGEEVEEVASQSLKLSAYVMAGLGVVLMPVCLIANLV